MDKEYWEQYYTNNNMPGDQSPFANEIIKYLSPNTTLLDLGCGNGRDALFFSNNEIDVTGIDQASTEIDFLNEKFSKKNLRFVCDDFTKISKLDSSFDSIYSRFTLHAISEKQEDNVLLWIKKNLNPNGLFFLEVRSIKDELFNEGTPVDDEKNARITTHYRRFSDFQIIKQKLVDIGLDLIFSIEENNLAVYKDENPIVIRLIAKQKS